MILISLTWLKDFMLFSAFGGNFFNLTKDVNRGMGSRQLQSLK
jgi:hypothetical protein